MEHGILFTLANFLINSLKYLNLVELFKFVGKKITPKNTSIETEITYSRIAVDIFISLKWLFLFFLILVKPMQPIITIIVWYLLLSNLYTYFYYHTWSSSILIDPFMDHNRIKRRFFNLILAMAYSTFGFSYLYFHPYSSDFHWGSSTPKFLNALWFSISNSLTSGYDQVMPMSECGRTIAMIQLLIIFIFITIIISGSIPQPKEQED